MTAPGRPTRRRRVAGATRPGPALPRAQTDSPLIAVELTPPPLIQAAWRAQPALRTTPLAVARPGGALLCVCPLADEAGVAAGQSATQAQLRAPDLQIAPDPVTARLLYDDLLDTLRTLSPAIEATDGDAGLAFLDARGLAPLWRVDPAHWDGMPVAREVVRLLAGQGLAVRVGVGPTRVVARALARRMGAGGPRALMGADARDILRSLPLADPALGLTPAAVLALHELGLTTAGALAALPSAGVALRFGADVRAAWHAASGQPEAPLRPWVPPERLVARRRIEEGLADSLALERVVRALTQQLAAQVAARGRAVALLALHLECDGGTRQVRGVRLWPPLQTPAALALAALDLLAHLRPQAPVECVALQATDRCLPNLVQGGLWSHGEVDRRRARLAAVLLAEVRSHGPGLLRRWCPDPLAEEGWRHDAAEPAP